MTVAGAPSAGRASESWTAPGARIASKVVLRVSFETTKSTARSVSRADIVILDDLYEMSVEAVFIEGKLTAHKGRLLVDLSPYVYPDTVKNSVRRAPLKKSDLEVRSDAAQVTGNCLVAIPDQNLTDALKVTLPLFQSSHFHQTPS